MPDTEPDNYSLDDMMRRLKSRSHGTEGEPQLVTRPDGSQAIKVRKRKRRTRQPHKEAEKRRRRRTLVAITAVMLLVMGLGFGVLGWVFYLNSGGYRDEIAGRLRSWTGAELEMRKFRATPVSASAEALEMKWPDQVPAATLSLRNLHADLRVSSHLTGIWKGKQVEASRGDLVLRAVSEPRPVRLPEEPLPFLLPVRVAEFNIRFGEGERAALSIAKASASLTVPDPDQPVANVVLKDGICWLDRWGRFKVNFASMRLEAGEAYVGMIRIAPEGVADAEFQISGDGFPAIRPEGGDAEFRLKVHSMPAAPLFGQGLGSIFYGTLETKLEDGTGRLRIDPTRLDSLSIDVPVTVTADLMAQRLPMLTMLADWFQTSQLKTPRFDAGSSLRVVRSGDRVVLDELDLVADGLIRLRGRITEEKGGHLSGTLETGIADEYFEVAGGAARAGLFRAGGDGYRWIRVDLSGTTKNPADNLDALASGATAAEEASPRPGPPRSREEEFRALTTPGD